MSGTEPPLTASDDPYKKIHVYTSLNDVANYCLLQNKTELDSALCDLKSYASETKRETESDSDIRITVQFASDLAQTEAFLSFRNTIKNATSLSEIREAKEKFHNFSKKYHSAIRKDNLPLLSNIAYTSITEIAYSPYVVIEASQSAIYSSSLLALACNGTVASITLEACSLYETNTEMLSHAYADESKTSSAYGNEKSITWDDMLTYIGAKSIVDAGVYQGAGIRIGVIDTGMYDSNCPNLKNQDITNKSNDSGLNPHPTTVLSVIARIAPQASFVYSTLSLRDPCASLITMIDNNCDVVNISQSMITVPSGNYEYTPSVDGIFDYLIYYNSIIVVKSSGNNTSSSGSSSPVTNPGFAYNVITVGGVTMTDRNYIVYDSTSRFCDSTDFIKPNVCGMLNYPVPDTNTIYSLTPTTTTSFAAPQVTGCIALLLEYYYNEYRTWIFPEQMMALVMCGAEKTDDYSVNNLGLNHFDKRVGAGIFNLQNCFDPDIVVENVYIPTNATATSSFYNATIHLDAGETLCVATSLLVDTELSPTDSSSIVYPVDFVNYNLFLVSADTGYGITFSVLSDESNIELLRYTAYTAGDYIIQVKISGEPANGVEFLGIAYTVYD